MFIYSFVIGIVLLINVYALYHVTEPERPEDDLYTVENIVKVDYLNSNDYYIQAVVTTKDSTVKSVYVKAPFEHKNSKLVCYSNSSIEKLIEKNHTNNVFRGVALLMSMVMIILTFTVTAPLNEILKHLKNDKS